MKKFCLELETFIPAIFLATLTIRTADAFVCSWSPHIPDHRPCGHGIVCSFNMTNQQLSETFLRLREVNGVPSFKLPLILPHFGLFHTDLTFLDLSPLVNLRVDALYMSSNPAIGIYVGPSSNFGLILTRTLEMTTSRITEFRLGDSLRQFSPQMRELNLRYNELRGMSADFKVTGQSLMQIEDQGQRQQIYQQGHEFLSGLGALVNLEALHLEGNRISKLSHWPFYTNNRLRTLSLNTNWLEEIGPDGLLLAPPPFELKETWILIDLKNNGRLGEVKFSPDNGIDRIGRPVHLNLGYCNFTTIPQLTFEKCLRADPRNEVDLEGNPLLCDKSTDWLRERGKAREFERRVLNTMCKNEQEKTVFTWMGNSAGKFVISKLLALVAVFSTVLK